VTYANAVLYSDNRTVSFTCIAGHWFTDGQRELDVTCDPDGSWVPIDPCSGKYLTIIHLQRNNGSERNFSESLHNCKYNDSNYRHINTNFHKDNENLYLLFCTKKLINTLKGLDGHWSSA